MYEDYSGSDDFSYDPYTADLPAVGDEGNLGNLFGDNLGGGDNPNINLDPGTNSDYIGGGDNPNANLDPAGMEAALKAAGYGDLWNKLKGIFVDSYGKVNYGALAGVGGALLTATGLGKPKTSGYQGTIPKMVATRERINYDDANRRPGAGGRRYFTDTQFTNAAGVPAAQAAAQEQAAGILAGYKPNTETSNTGTTSLNKSAFPQPTVNTQLMAAGGQATMNPPRYLRGVTDGMEDKINTSIDGQQPAKLSHGEFVIPADVVSHLGNGNSDAGAKKLYQMMDRVRQARTGTKQQGRQINADKFMPGGKVGYQSGGIVAFDVGGTVGTNSTVESNLSNWAGDYVTDTLGKAQAAADQPYQAYQGPLTAGASDLQNQAFAGMSNLANTSYSPGSFTANKFDSNQAAQYMNPYIQNALNPQLNELRRQSQINNLGVLSKAGQAGGMDGSRRALMESEGIRNLLSEQDKAIGTGYANAYDKAAAQFNADQNRGLDVQKANEASRQFGANYDKGILEGLGNMGATQRGIESEGIAADKNEFENQRDWDMKMQQYKLGLLQKLPVEAKTNTANTNPLIEALASTGTLTKLFQSMGLIPTEGNAATSAGVTKPV